MTSEWDLEVNLMSLNDRQAKAPKIETIKIDVFLLSDVFEIGYFE